MNRLRIRFFVSVLLIVLSSTVSSQSTLSELIEESAKNPNANGQPLDGETEYPPTNNVQPRYPIKAIMRNLEGRVLIEFDISATGRAIAPRVVRSTFRVFDNISLKTIRKLEFAAKSVNNVRVVIEYKMLDGKKDGFTKISIPTTRKISLAGSTS